jgi:hypothetical protein
VTFDPVVAPDQEQQDGAKPVVRSVARAAARLRPAGIRRVGAADQQRLRAVGGLVLGLALLQAAFTLVFAWPGPGSTMHALPVAVAGPTTIAELAARNLEAQPRGAMTVTRLPDAAAARRAVLHRDVYGALVIEENGLRLFIASAGSPTVAAQLVQAVDRIQARGQGTYLEVEDLAPNPRHDPRGLAPGAAVLAVLATSLGAGIIVMRSLRSTRERLVALLAFAACAGLLTALVLGVVLRTLTGSLLLEAGVLALLVLATAATTTAFGVIADLPGTGLAVAVLLALGYPISGATSAPEFVPAPWDALGRYLPAGAGSTALRSVAYFDGAAASPPVIVLLAWSIVALLVISAARFLRPAR